MVKKEEKKIDIGDILGASILIAMAVFALMFLGASIGYDSVDIKLNQETGDDICKQLTGNSTAVASDEKGMAFDGGKLICTIQIFDSTQNIIVKNNN